MTTQKNTNDNQQEVSYQAFRPIENAVCIDVVDGIDEQGKKTGQKVGIFAALGDDNNVRILVVSGQNSDGKDTFDVQFQTVMEHTTRQALSQLLAEGKNEGKTANEILKEQAAAHERGEKNTSTLDRYLKDSPEFKSFTNERLLSGVMANMLAGGATYEGANEKYKKETNTQLSLDPNLIDLKDLHFKTYKEFRDKAQEFIDNGITFGSDKALNNIRPGSVVTLSGLNPTGKPAELLTADTIKGERHATVESYNATFISVHKNRNIVEEKPEMATLLNGDGVNGHWRKVVNFNIPTIKTNLAKGQFPGLYDVGAPQIAVTQHLVLTESKQNYSPAPRTDTAPNKITAAQREKHAELLLGDVLQSIDDVSSKVTDTANAMRGKPSVTVKYWGYSESAKSKNPDHNGFDLDVILSGKTDAHPEHNKLQMHQQLADIVNLRTPHIKAYLGEMQLDGQNMPRFPMAKHTAAHKDTDKPVAPSKTTVHRAINEQIRSEMRDHAKQMRDLLKSTLKGGTAESDAKKQRFLESNFGKTLLRTGALVQNNTGEYAVAAQSPNFYNALKNNAVDFYQFAKNQGKDPEKTFNGAKFSNLLAQSANIEHKAASELVFFANVLPALAKGYDPNTGHVNIGNHSIKMDYDPRQALERRETLAKDMSMLTREQPWLTNENGEKFRASIWKPNTTTAIPAMAVISAMAQDRPGPVENPYYRLYQGIEIADTVLSTRATTNLLSNPGVPLTSSRDDIQAANTARWVLPRGAGQKAVKEMDSVNTNEFAKTVVAAEKYKNDSIGSYALGMVSNTQKTQHSTYFSMGYEKNERGEPEIVGNFNTAKAMMAATTYKQMQDIRDLSAPYQGGTSVSGGAKFGNLSLEGNAAVPKILSTTGVRYQTEQEAAFADDKWNYYPVIANKVEMFGRPHEKVEINPIISDNREAVKHIQEINQANKQVMDFASELVKKHIMAPSAESVITQAVTHAAMNNTRVVTVQESAEFEFNHNNHKTQAMQEAHAKSKDNTQSKDNHDPESKAKKIHAPDGVLSDSEKQKIAEEVRKALATPNDADNLFTEGLAPATRSHGDKSANNTQAKAPPAPSRDDDYSPGM
ncbi:hypothetical protein ACFBZI_11270 [Moraxella sp. ZJ142]|uniref:hypothetical protein n=1 Tax=Moraxella marmotae TaxID=3344520 RepID=UPI0035D4563E